jgi:uncharacterized protein (DUF1330 family)
MAKGYWVVSLEVTNPEAYRAYQEFVRPFLAANDGRFLIRGGQQEVVEGSVKPRVVVIEFPSYEHAAQVYHSEAYQNGLKLRLGASMADFAIVEGFDAP